MDVDTIRSICTKLPAVTEDMKWGNDLCFMVAEKMFCVVVLDGPLKISFKVPDEEFDELCNLQEIMPAPYSARYKWVLVEKPHAFSKKQWEHYITQSYNLIRAKLPKSKLKKLDKSHQILK
jgi:predicted DNA-binding protein (MmcQ/YjbR family)